MSHITVRPIQTRLFVLLLRAFTAAVVFIVIFMLTATAYFLVYPSSYSPIDRLPIVIRLETYYLVKNNWQGVEALPQSDLLSDYHRFWQRSILLNGQGNVVLDHGSAQSALIGTAYTRKSEETAIPILSHEKVVATLLLDASFFPIQRQLSLDFLWPIGVISFLMAIPTIIIGLFLMRRFVTPLAEVIAAAREVADGDLSARVLATGPQDLRALSDSFNHMAASLEQSDSERRNMLADIAHELRTPLTVMRGRLEGIVDGVYAASPEQIGPALEETYLLERLVEDLRLLTLVETRQLHIEHRDVDMNATASHVFDLFQAEAEEKQITLSLQTCDSDAVAALDPQRIEQVVGNLVSNALRYTPESGNVQIKVEKSAGLVWLTVSDDGPGVAPADLDNIFQRFWRGERSRSRASGGAGLGLAIARQLVEAQGGQIHAVNRSTGGLQISLQFPLRATI
jgi:signal transduction histidine kinase